MKINTVHTSNRIAKRFNRSGMTLIEISLVIALLLGLIAVVFLGIGSYRAGADKAKCKMQLAAVQKAIRAGANFDDLALGGALVEADVFGAGLMMETEPVCPQDPLPLAPTFYTWGTVVPAVGTPYGNCSEHPLVAGTDTKDW